MKGMRWVCLALIVTAGSGCATAVMTGVGRGDHASEVGRNDRQVPRDAEISAAVTRALVRHPQVPAMPIRVRTDRGRVTLSGEVPDTATARLAARLAAGVPGVGSVRNLLRVEQ